jgi:hypothetical protein
MNFAGRTLATLSATTLVTIAVHAQVSLNELFINPPGTDNGFEFVEIRTGSPSVSLDSYWFIGIEGDGAASGTVDFAYNLSAFSSGANGYLLIRDAASVLSPAPDAAAAIGVQDFAPDLENGSNTYLLVRNFTGTVGQDLDTDGDGIAETTPWTSVADGISLIENDGAANVGYAAQFGYTIFPAQANFNADALYRLTDGTWAGSDTIGTGTGPFTVDSTRAAVAGSGSAELQGTLTPGSANAIAVVPEPGTIALLIAGAAGLVALRRR